MKIQFPKVHKIENVTYPHCPFNEKCLHENTTHPSHGMLLGTELLACFVNVYIQNHIYPKSMHNNIFYIVCKFLWLCPQNDFAPFYFSCDPVRLHLDTNGIIPSQWATSIILWQMKISMQKWTVFLLPK